MPSQLREALLLLFRNRPTLAPGLLREALHVELPAYTEARIEAADLTDVQPAEYRADLVMLLYLDPDRMPLYFDLVLTSLSEAARRSLRAMNRFNYEYQSDFARKYYYGGEAAMLLKLLQLKFGPLPDAVTARVRSASPDELNAWVERVLSASSVDEVLG